MSFNVDFDARFVYLRRPRDGGCQLRHCALSLPVWSDLIGMTKRTPSYPKFGHSKQSIACPETPGFSIPLPDNQLFRRAASIAPDHASGICGRHPRMRCPIARQNSKGHLDFEHSTLQFYVYLYLLSSAWWRIKLPDIVTEFNMERRNEELWRSLMSHDW
jgi:hypothetical protein